MPDKISNTFDLLSLESENQTCRINPVFRYVMLFTTL